MKRNKKKWTLWNSISLTGLPWFVIFAVCGYFFKDWYCSNYTRHPFIYRDITDIQEILLGSALGWIVVVARNVMHMGIGKEIGLFTWLDPYKYIPPNVSARKRNAQYPNIPSELLSDAPDGFVIGKKGKRFVRVPLKKGNILSAIIMGSTGCGKSVLLLTMLLYQLHRAPTNKKKCSPPMTFYCLDCKPELANKSCVIRGNKKVRVMNPLDRTTYGWDVYYKLSSTSTDDEIFSEMDLICRALIDAGKADKNEFFYQSGRNIATGILFYTFKQGWSFIKGIDYLLNEELSSVVRKTLDQVSERPEYRMVKTLLSPYADKDGEAFQGIELAIREGMSIFIRQNVKFFFDGNPRKTSPLDLENQISIFFSLHENLLEEYKTVLRLTTMQVMAHSKERPEDANMLTLIIDEAARLGAINWTEFLATSRSHQINTILAFQGISQMQKVWGKEDAKTLLELCRVIEVLSCSDPDMAKVLSDWAGDYLEEKHTTNNRTAGSSSTSYEDKKIITQADILSLQENKEAIAFVKGQYMRMDVEHARYYNIPSLNKISEACKATNNKDSM